jgi:hypothetical protein
MTSQGGSGVRGGSHSASNPARILSLVGVISTAALLLLIYVIPVYTTEGATSSSPTGSAIQSTGSATLFATNPQALSVLMAITALAIATLLLTLVTTWSTWSPARWTLLALLIPLTGLTILGLFSVGVFMAPLVTISWIVFAIRLNGSREGDGR